MLEDIFSAQESIKQPKKQVVTLSPERVREIAEVELSNKFTYFLMQHPRVLREFTELRLTENDTEYGQKELPSACSRGGKPKLWILALAFIEANNWIVRWDAILDELEKFTNKSISPQSAKSHLTTACRAMSTVFNMDLYYDKTTEWTKIRSIEERDIQLEKHLKQLEKGLNLTAKDVYILQSSNQELPEETKNRLQLLNGKLSAITGGVSSIKSLMPETEWGHQVA